jgi:GH24 family phage-related lysozyme (muramidase)
MAITQAMIDNTKTFEGSVAHMYLDTESKVTVGVGFLLANAAAGVNLGFIKRTGGATASAGDVSTDWTAVSVEAPNQNQSAGYYEQFTKLDLPDPAIDMELKKRLQSFETELKNIYTA